MIMMMAKGPWSLGPCAPHIHSAALHVHATASKERQSLEGVADQKETKPNQSKGSRAKAKRGFSRLDFIGFDDVINCKCME